MAQPLTKVNKIINQTINCLVEYIPVSSAYLFGSYANGSATKGSDIDLAIFSPAVGTIGLEEKINLISLVQKAIGAEVEIHLFSNKQLKEARPSNFYGYILKTGKRIL
jgi:predicted nucleotidyltransferase